MQAIYYFGESESGYVATAFFHEHYYATNYYGSDSYTGVISLNSESSHLKGCYYFIIADNAMTIYPQPLYEVPSVPEYYHYPTFLGLLDNMEYIHDWKNQDMGGIKIWVESSHLAKVIILITKLYLMTLQITSQSVITSKDRLHQP